LRVNSVTVRSPATTANLGPGFDVHGLALDVMHDEVTVEACDKGVKIELEGCSKGIPLEPRRNSAGIVALELKKRFRISNGVKLKIRKGIPPSSGLGSSGASAAGAAVAINNAFKLNLRKEELIEVSARGEVASAGVAHADNVAPAVCGGFTVILSYNPIRVLEVPPPGNLVFALAVPEVSKGSTRRAREVLPTNVELRKVTRNVSGASAVVAGMILSNPKLVGYGMLGDVIVEPARARIFPWFKTVREAALEAGASGVALSGAGPTVIAVVDPNEVNAGKVAEAMRRRLEDSGVSSRSYLAKPTCGVEVISVE